MGDQQPKPALPDGYIQVAELGARVSLLRRLSDGQLVAAKHCPPQDTPCQARLQQEADLLARLDHPNIIPRLDWLQQPQPLLLTPYIAGATLAQRYGDQPAVLPLPQLSALLTPLLSALAAIHAAGFIHGDLSPHNILLQQDGQPLLLDLGSAMPIAGPPPTDSLQATTGFSPPEAWSGQPMGAWSDIRALAAVSYGLISGHYPGDDADTLPTRPDCPAPAGFIDAILRALDPNPAQRPQSIAEFAAAMGLDRAAADERAPAKAALQDLPAPAVDSPDSPGYPQSDLPATETLPRAPGIQTHPPVSTAELDGAQWQAATATSAQQSRPPPRRSSGSRVLPLLLLLTLTAAAAWWGPDWYRSHLQMDWRVAADGSGDATTISEALANAPDDARITISAGNYPESLRVQRPMTLIGDGEVNIRPPAGPCLRFLASHGGVHHLNLASAAPKPVATDSNPRHSKPNPNPKPGPKPDACVEVIGGSPILEDNRIHADSGPALLLSGGSQATVGLNDISADHGPGIVIDDASGGTIASNQIHDTGRSAIIVRGGSAPDLHCNQIDAPAQAGLLIEDGSHPAIETNRIQNSGSSGIEVRAGAHPQILHNLIEMSDQAGIYLHSGAAPTLTNNQILASGFSGIIAADSSQPTLSGNTISASGEHGILLLPGSQVTLQNNRISDNDGNGLVIAAGAQLRSDGNQLNGNRSPQTIDGRGR